MSTQTQRPARKPNSNRAARNSRRYNKQTAHVAARRDGKPLFMGWGRQFSHTEKVRIQRRATWGLAILIVFLLVSVIVGAWINFNIIIPGRAITSVNGHDIPQSEYREMVAVKTQIELNKLYGPNGLTPQLTSLQQQDAQVSNTISTTNTQITNLQNQIKALPAGTSTKRTDLTAQLTQTQKTLATETTQHQNLQAKINDLNSNQIPLEKQGFTQSQIGNDSATWLQDDELIREWLTTQSFAIQTKVTPTATQINNDFNALKKNMPTTNGYNAIFSSMGVSDDQIRSMLTILDRRTNMQNYLQPQLVSPSYQVLARQIVVPTQQKANQTLQQLQKGKDFGALAKSNSQDTNTASKGGDLGWMTRYQYIDPSGNVNGSPVVDNWLFDPSRTLNEISPVLYANSAYYIIQFLNVDPSRAVDATLLKALQTNALVNWAQERHYLPGQHITAVDQNMVSDSNNLPPNNVLPSTAPGIVPTPTPAI